MIGKSSNCIKNGWILNIVLPISSIPASPICQEWFQQSRWWMGYVVFQLNLGLVKKRGVPQKVDWLWLPLQLQGCKKGPCTLMILMVFSRNCCGDSMVKNMGKTIRFWGWQDPRASRLWWGQCFVDHGPVFECEFREFRVAFFLRSLPTQPLVPMSDGWRQRLSNVEFRRCCHGRMMKPDFSYGIAGVPKQIRQIERNAARTWKMHGKRTWQWREVEKQNNTDDNTLLVQFSAASWQKKLEWYNIPARFSLSP